MAGSQKAFRARNVFGTFEKRASELRWYNKKLPCFTRAVFKWLSKVITRFQLLFLVIGLKISRQFINQWKPKPMATCTCDFSRALSKLHGIAANRDCFIALFTPAVIGRSNYFVTVLRHSIENPSNLKVQHITCRVRLSTVQKTVLQGPKESTVGTTYSGRLCHGRAPL